MSVRKRLEAILRELHERNPEIEGAIVSRSDGLLIADSIHTNTNKTLMAAMVAAIFNISRRTLRDLEKGTFKTIVLEGEHGYIVVMGIKANLVLATSIKKDANIGLVLLEMQRSLEKIAEEL